MDPNAEWREAVEWPIVERFDVQSADGARIESWLLRPASPGPHPTVLYAHGGPHAAWGWGYSEDVQELVGAGYAVVLPNNRGSSGYGDAFSTAICGRWGELELHDFDAALDDLVARGIADPARVAITGVSGGGHLSAWAVTQRDRYAAAIPDQGVYSMISMYGVADVGAMLTIRELGGRPHEIPDVYWQRSPVAHAHRCRTPTLLIQGEDDIRCPMQQAEEMYTALRLGGCEVELLRMRGCNHGMHMVGPPHLRRARMNAIKDWLARHLC